MRGTSSIGLTIGEEDETCALLANPLSAAAASEIAHSPTMIAQGPITFVRSAADDFHNGSRRVTIDTKIGA